MSTNIYPTAHSRAFSTVIHPFNGLQFSQIQQVNQPFAKSQIITNDKSQGYMGPIYQKLFNNGHRIIESPYTRSKFYYVNGRNKPKVVQQTAYLHGQNRWKFLDEDFSRGRPVYNEQRHDYIRPRTEPTCGMWQIVGGRHILDEDLLRGRPVYAGETVQGMVNAIHPIPQTIYKFHTIPAIAVTYRNPQPIPLINTQPVTMNLDNRNQYQNRPNKNKVARPYYYDYKNWNDATADDYRPRDKYRGTLVNHRDTLVNLKAPRVCYDIKDFL